MQRILIILAILLLPLAAFADFQIGPTAFYNFYVSEPDDLPGAKELSVNDFTFGLDTRLKLSIFQAGAFAFFQPGYEDDPGSIELFTNLGIALDIFIFRFGVGLGPNLIVYLGDPGFEETVNLGMNLKLSGEVMLGGISIGLNYLMDIDLSEDSADIFKPENIEGLLGVSVLFKIF
ncbi:MAG: hypothetical protein JW881_12065 [Spirochaetales bacterium]|nr:hypothetical protein [Spirochaetales bacterium]